MKQSVSAIAIATIIAAQASAAVWTFNDPMTGSQEVPANASPALGNINGKYDDVSNLITYSMTWSGLTGTTNNAHFHSAPIGVAGGVQIGPAGFPLGVTAGSFGSSHVLSAAQETQLMTGLWYFNIHSTTFSGGEIRGQITLVPAPGAAAVFGLAGLLAARRRR
jgi:CHRD domain